MSECCRENTWHRERGPDAMYAVCSICGRGQDIGWGPRPDYFPGEAPDDR